MGRMEIKTKQNKMDDLLEIIKKSDDEVDFYLSDTSVEKFRKDIKYLVKKYSNKEILRLAIKRLSELADGNPET